MELTFCLEHVESQAPKGGAWHSPEEMTTAPVRVRNVGMSHLQARCSWAFLAVVQRAVCGCPGADCGASHVDVEGERDLPDSPHLLPLRAGHGGKNFR